MDHKQSPDLSEEAILTTLGQFVAADQLAALLQFREELLAWNTHINLTAITNPTDVLLKHFLDSLTLLDAIPASRVRLLDIGAGAGFPGLPLKIARPAWEIVLLEATGKKVNFQRHVSEKLGLTGLETLHGRAEELAHNPTYRGTFDVVTARAVASLPVLLEYAAPFCRAGGRILLPKKGDLHEELTHSHQAARQLGLVLQADLPVTLPGLDDGRRILIWEQHGRCPDLYPRASTLIAKRPLA